MPPTTASLDAEVVEQPETVARGVPISERLAVELRLAEAPLIPRDDPELVPQRVDLGGEHLPVHQEAVAEDHRRAVAAAVLEADPLTVDLGDRHVLDSTVRGLGPSVDPPRAA